MAPEAEAALKTTDALKTYRYLRIAMLVAVVLLGVSILIEFDGVRGKCLQTSISAYYYTPVRAIFVGGLIVVGFALIVIKGRTFREDVCLNIAGMLAPVVAVAPTMDIGDCWSLEPMPYPKTSSGDVAPWVIANVDNNFKALLIAGVLGLLVAIGVAIKHSRPGSVEPVRLATWVSLTITTAALVLGWWAHMNWDSFHTRAHGFAAVAMFVFLIGAVVFRALERKDKAPKYFGIYAFIAAAMPIGGILIAWTRVFDRHTVFALEAYEIALFAAFWLVQTAETWNEKVKTPTGEGVPA